MAHCVYSILYIDKGTDTNMQNIHTHMHVQLHRGPMHICQQNTHAATYRPPTAYMCICIYILQIYTYIYYRYIHTCSWPCVGSISKDSISIGLKIISKKLYL